MSDKSKKLVFQELEVVKPLQDEYREILTPEALQFLLALVKRFSANIEELLKKRVDFQRRIDSGYLPQFLEETKEIREKDWTVASLPEDLLNRRVEITGPVDRKMIINALNSGANVFMADFEDSNSPTWENIIQGQVNLRDAVNKTIEFTKPDGSKQYKLKQDTAVLMVRPRGLHLKEVGIEYGGNPIPGSLIDFGLYFFHNAHELIQQETGPYFYLPKLQHYLEARLWNDIFNFAQDYMDIPRGTIKATVLVEHILVAFQMDEILYELRQHSAGLNCGRWDYIFSFIKVFNTNPQFLLPDRSQVTMEVHFMKSYVNLLIKTCHRRNVHAMGGMAAQIPIKEDPEQNQIALEKVRLDKVREVTAGHDGTWVAHPGLIGIAKAAFDEGMKTPNQIEKIPQVTVTAEDLIQVPNGTITEEGVRLNINVGLRYLSSWLCGNGCVPIFHLMEDAATAEISRSQLWQWVHHQASLENGGKMNEEFFLRILQEETEKIQQEIGTQTYEQQKYDLAKSIFKNLTLQTEFPEFLTLEAYQYLS